MSIRASDADLVLSCAAASMDPDLKVDTETEAANLGMAVHDSLAAWIEGGMTGDPEHQPHANTHGAPAIEVGRLISYAPRALGQIKESLAGLRAEVAVSHELVRGRADAISVMMTPTGPFAISILDWKTGRDSSHSKPGQMTAYALAAVREHGMPSCGYVYTAEIWLREQLIIERRLDQDAIDGFATRLGQKVGRESYTPGSHCRWCRLRMECPARDAYLRSACKAFVDIPTGEITADKVAKLWDTTRALGQALEAYDSIVGEMLKEGPIELPDGSRLELVERNTQRIDPRKAWPVLVDQGLSQDEIAECISLSKTKLLAVIGRKAVKRKGEAKGEMMRRLDEADAVSIKRGTQRKRTRK